MLSNVVFPSRGKKPSKKGVQRYENFLIIKAFRRCSLVKIVIHRVNIDTTGRFRSQTAST